MSIKVKLIQLSNWFTPARLSKIFVAAVILNMIFTAMLMINFGRVQADGRSNGKYIRSIVETVERYTSPEQQEKNDERLNDFANALILSINCDDQENDQRIVNLFVSRGYLTQEEADILTEECKSQAEEEAKPEAATTTTVPDD